MWEGERYGGREGEREERKGEGGPGEKEGEEQGSVRL